MLVESKSERRHDTHLDHLGGDEAEATVPARRGVVEHVEDTEAVVLLGELLQLITEEDIFLIDVGEDQVNFSGVVTAVAGTVADNGLNDLQHGGDTGTSSNHTDVTAHVGGVDHSALGTAHLQGVADLEGGEILGDVALRIGLDKEIKVAGLVVGGDGGVGADDLLGLTLDGRGERDVLTDGETEDIGGAGQCEPVDGDIVGDIGLLLQDKVLELTGVEDLSRLWVGLAN